MIKKFFSLLLTLCMVLAMMPVVTKPVTVQAAPVQSVRIGGRVVDGAITGGVVLDSTHKYYHNGENGGLGTADANSENAVAEFDANAGTLTLNGLNIDTDQPGIWWKYSDSGNHDLTIVLADGTTNTITNTNGSGILGDSGYPNVGPSLTIQGGGTLNVTGSASGIWVWHNITIQGNAVVDATGTTKMGICNNDSKGKITIGDSAVVIATGNSSDSENDAYGIGFDHGRSNIPVIQGGTVTMTGGKAAVMASPTLSRYTGGCKVTVGNTAEGSTEWNGREDLKGYKYIKIEQGEHTHSWSDSWSNDATHHWSECEKDGCNITTNSGKIGYEEHHYNNDNDVDCDTCGYTRILCTHSSATKVDGQAATCTSPGWKEHYQCASCKKFFEEQACTTLISNLDTWKNGDGKIPALGHDWTYSVAGATLIASCNRKASCGMADQTLTLTISEPLSYTGSGLTPASFGATTSGWATNVSSTLPTIKYYKTNTKDAVEDGTEVTENGGKPISAGYYYASATVGTGGNSATVVKAFEIQKAEAAFSTEPVGATTLIYNMSAQNLLTTQATTSDGTIQYAVTTTESQPEDSAFRASTPKATDAGTYHVYYKVAGDANHKDKICATPVEVTIDKASQSVSAPTASETKATKVTLNEVVGHGTKTYAKNTTNEAPTDPSAWQASNVFTALTKNTTYYFFAKCAGNDNYLEGTSTGISIATSDLTSSTITGVTAKEGVNTTGISYGTAITPSMLFTGTPVLTDATNPDTACKYEGVNSTVYPENTAAPTAVGTYKLVIVMNDDNYYGTQDIPFTIVKSSPAAVNATGVAPTGSNVSDGKIQVTGVDTSLYSLEYMVKGTSPEAWTPIEGTEVTNLAAGGTYLVRIKGTNNNNASPTTEVTIPAYVAPPAGGGIGGGGGSNPGGSTGGNTGDYYIPPTTTDNDTKTEPTTLPDGTKVETSTTVDETTGATTVEEKKTALDGTVTETKTTTQKDGSSQTTSMETRTDGSTTETNTTVDTEGTAKSVVLDKDFPTGDVLTIRKTEEPNGEVSYVLATLETEEATIVKAKVERAEALANMKNIPYRVKVLDENGKLDYKVRVNTGDVKANQTLYVYKYDSKTKSFGLVQADHQKVKADEKANISCDFENLISTQRYQLVTKSKAGLLDKKILATVKAKIGQKSLKVNQSTSFKLDEKLNLENVSTIKYSTSDKQVVKVSKAGKITGKNTGTADIKATITLINGKTKTVRMKIKVK